MPQVVLLCKIANESSNFTQARWDVKSLESTLEWMVKSLTISLVFQTTACGQATSSNLAQSILHFFCSLSSLPIYKSAIKSSCGCEQIVAVLQIIQNSQTKKLSKDVCALSVKKNLLVEFKIFIVTKKTLNGTIWFQILLNTSYPSNVNVIFTLFEAAFIVISCKC